MSARYRSWLHRVQRWASNLVLAVALVVVGFGAAAVISGRFQVQPVLSGSMRPGLPVGGVVITERVPVSTLQVRDVLLFQRPGHPDELVVHRIVSLVPGPGGPTVQTQGDANNTPDPWQLNLHGSSAYRAVFSLPLVGYAAVWVHGPSGRAVLLMVGLLLIIGAAVSGLVHHRRTRTATAVAQGPPEQAT